MAILKTKHLKKYYGEGASLVKALDDVNVEIQQGEFVAVIGTSGSGKSTLLNMLGGLDVPSSGSVKVENLELSDLKEEELTAFRRRRIGFIFQNYNLVPMLNVYENIVLPLELDGQQPDQAYIQKIVKLLKLDTKLKSMPNKLSGGQQQRVAIDEPTGNLDSKTSDDVIQLLKMTSRTFDQTIVMITHNDEIARNADRAIRIEDGKIAD